MYFVVFNTTSSVKLFEVTVQIFVYKLLYTIAFFGKIKNYKIFKGRENFQNIQNFMVYLYVVNLKKLVIKLKKGQKTVAKVFTTNHCLHMMAAHSRKHWYVER